MALYSDFKVFHFPEKLDSLPRHKPITAPLHIRLKPTNACNHRCRYCAYRDLTMQLGKDMREADSIPREKMLELCRDIVEMGVLAVTFSGGGEPLIYPHLLEGARILQEGGVKIACLTNGARLRGEMAEFLAHHATWVRVSMDGWDDASYTRYRGVGPGEYTQIIDNIEKMARIGGSCILGVSYIVDAENHTHIPEVVRRLKDAGARSVKISACITSNEAAEVNAYHAPHFKRTAQLIQEARETQADANFEIVNAWHTVDGRFEKGYEWCPFSQVLTVIGADLGVYPCQDKAYNEEARLGLLRDKNLRQWWFAHKEAFFALRPTEHCRHHCIANKKNTMILEYLSIEGAHQEFV